MLAAVLVATVLATMVLATGLAGSVAPAAADPQGGGAGSTALKSTAQGGAELVVAPQTPVLEASAEQAQFRVLLRNGADEALPEGSIRLSIGARIENDEGLANATATPEMLHPNSFLIASEQVGATAAQGEQELTVTVPLSDMLLLTIKQRGVYQLYANYLPTEAGAAPELLAASPLVWEGVDAPNDSVNLTLIVPLMLPSDIDAMPTPAQLGDLSPRWTALLDFAGRTQSVLAIDPRITAAVRAYGNAAPQTAQDVLARLERTTLTSFALQFGDADPAAQAALGANALMGPLGLEFITRLGEWDAAPGAGTDPAPDPPTGATDPAPGGTGVAPGLDELVEWAPGLDAAWPAPGQANARTLSLLRSSGLDVTVLRSDNVELAGGPRAALDDGRALVTDAALDTGVRAALGAPTSTERELGAASAAARLLVAAQSDVRGLILGVDRGGIADAPSPAELLDSLISPAWANTVGLGIQAQGTATLVEGSPDPERIGLLETATGNEAYVVEVRALLVTPVHLDGYQRIRLLSLFATAGAAPDADFAATAAAFAERDAALHDGVHVIDTKHAQLVGAQTRIPIQVRNSLPFDAIVNLRVAPTSAALAIAERSYDELILPEDSTERVLVPVNSRVSSGESGLLISVTSLDGGFTASNSVLPISISTTVEIVALAVLGVAVALLFGFGIRRSLRRRTQGGGIPRL